MTIDGATGASVSHPAHIHNGTATEGGSIEYYLAPIDGSDTASRSSKIVSEPYDTLTGFDGYINIHESVANLGNVVSQGNIGANAGLTSIADAREQDIGAEVTIQGTVTRAFGSYARIQDNSGENGASGIQIRQTEGVLSEQFQQDIEDGNITEGTVLRITGSLGVFTGTLQINNDDLASYVVVEQGTAPDPAEVTLDDLAAPGGETFESVLIEVVGLSFVEASGEFENGTTYTVQDENGTQFDFRVQNPDESALGGEPIPGGTFAFEGVLGQFNGNFDPEKGPDEGYQFIPVLSTDIVEPTQVSRVHKGY
jgi:hypothetical protein